MREVPDIIVPPTETAFTSTGRAAVARPFEFEVVTLDAEGRVVGRRRGRARQFDEDLGGGVSLEMVQVPGGAFVMGAPEFEAGSGGEERPQHRVSVRTFYLGKHALTVEQWEALTGARPGGMKTLDEKFMASGRQPVVRVSCEEAEEFCDRLSRATGRGYRLPSEAEWEYACRAGTTTPFAFGEAVTPELVNYDGGRPYAAAPEGECRAATVQVGGLGVANDFGLYDMHGNVWEWCRDFWHGDYEGAPDDGSAWRGEADKRTRVLRGGAWSFQAGFCRAAARSFCGEATVRSRNIGFRVASAEA